MVCPVNFFAGDTLQLADKALCSLVAARDGVKRSVNDFGDGQFGDPESGQIFHAEMSVLIQGVLTISAMIGCLQTFQRIK